MFKKGDKVKGIGKYSWMEGTIVGVNESGGYAILTKEGALAAVYEHEIKENTK